MAGFPWTLRSRRVVVDDVVRPAAIHIAGGRIVGIGDHAEATGDVRDVGDLVVMPGLVDAHVHVNDPGRAEWEGFPTATRAAAAGGTTTIVDMPLNCVPATTSAAALAAKQDVASGRCAVDVGFWGGIVPDNQAALPGLLDAGVLGCKAFLIDSGVPEFPPVDAARLREAMPLLQAAGVPLLVHAELAGPMVAAQRSFTTATDRRAYDAYVASRPAVAEEAAIDLVIDLVATTGAPAHILHLSAASALPAIAAARRRGLPVTAETCPHYLTLAAEEIPAGATEFKCAPPIRDRRNNERLWQGLEEGTIGFVASDHSPCTPELKRPDEGDFATAWGGIASLQLRLALTWTAARDRGHDLATVVRWLAAAPAQFAGLDQKGRIAVGADADLAVFDPDATWTVDARRLEHQHPVTPYDGRSVRGAVRTTFVRGEIVYDGGAIVQDAAGQLLLRRRTRP